MAAKESMEGHPPTSQQTVPLDRFVGISRHVGRTARDEKRGEEEAIRCDELACDERG
jgi:hypothetical protein